MVLAQLGYATNSLMKKQSSAPRLVRSYDLSIDGPQPLLSKFSQVRVPNDMANLEITVSDYQRGRGVVVSSLGDKGNAAQSGLVVGDVITEVNSEPVFTHTQALEAMRNVRGAELVFSLEGKAKKLTIDRSQPGKLEITLCGARKGGVEVEAVGLLGLAAYAGLRAGDKILSVNGTLVEHHDQAITMMDSCMENIEVTVFESEFDVHV